MKTLTTAILVCLTMFTVCVAQDKADAKEHKTEAKGESYSLPVSFEKGRKSRYKTSSVTTSSSQVMDQKTKSENSNGGITVFECTGIDKDGNASIVMSYDKVTMKIVANGSTTVDYDSTRDKLEDVDENYRVVAMLKDYKFTSTVSPEGKVTAVEGWDKYIEAVKKEADPQYAELYASMLTDATIRDAVEWMYYPAHKDDMKPGDSWEQKLESEKPMVGKLTYTRTYTFKEVAGKAGRNCLHLTLKGDIATEEGAAYQYTDVDWTGDVWVDAKTHEIVYDDSSMKFTMTMKFGTTEIKVPFEAHTTMELITEDADKPDASKDAEPDKEK